MSTRKWLRMSWWNVVLLVGVLAAAVVMAVLGRWVEAVVFAVVVLFLGASAVYARSGRSGDLTRLNAAEYLDERDRAAATQGFAAVGVTALLLGFALLVLATVLLEPGEPMFLVLIGNLLVLAVVWGVANWVALRRS